MKLLVLSLLLAGTGMTIGYKMITTASQQYASESKCIAEYIDMGFERAHITTHRGTCSHTLQD